jgi:hypothetical protein
MSLTYVMTQHLAFLAVLVPMEGLEPERKENSEVPSLKGK